MYGFKLIGFLLLIKKVFLYKLELKSAPYFPSGYDIVECRSFHSMPFLIPTLDICIGNPCQEFQVGFDTESYHSVVSLPSPKKIFHKAYNIALSSSIEGLQNYTVLFRYYLVKGLKTKDYISFSKQLNAPQPKNKQGLILLSEHNHLDGFSIDGFIGMIKEYNDNNLPYHTNFSLIEQLNLTKKQWGLSIDSSFKGFLYLDEELDISKHDNKCLSSYKARLSSEWFCNSQNIIMNGKVYKINGKASFATADPLIHLPGEASEFILEELNTVTKNKCTEINDIKLDVFSCDRDINLNSIPDLIINFEEGAVLRIKWKSLFQLMTIEGKEVYISKIVTRYNWHLKIQLGLPAFVDNTIIFDKESQMIGFIPGYDMTDDTLQAYFKLISKYLYVIMIVVHLIGISLVSYVKTLSQVNISQIELSI